MLDAVLGMLAGVGLFMFGMKTLSDALREVAGERLRRWLARATGTPLMGVATGAGVTALLQSSTATTVMTVGFVGGGLLTFQQSVGVVFGANLGSSSMGWLVTGAGQADGLMRWTAASLFGGAMLALLGRGRTVLWGRVLAGASLLLMGLEWMQDAAASGAVDWLLPAEMPDDSLLGRALLVVLGMALVPLLQSSGAGVAITLTLLGNGSIEFQQATAVVVGLNIGTTFTALLASIGGSVAMRRTALAHLFFNLGTAAMVGFMLTPAADAALWLTGGAEQTALALFHTGFSVLGIVLFLPLLEPFCRFIAWVAPDKQSSGISMPDAALLEDAGASLDAVQDACGQLSRDWCEALASALGGDWERQPVAALSVNAPMMLAQIERYLIQVPVSTDVPGQVERYGVLMHWTDHLRRLGQRAENVPPTAVLRGDAGICRTATLVGGLLGRLAEGPVDKALLLRLDRAEALLRRRLDRHRRRTLDVARRHAASVEVQFARTDAMRWLYRTLHHGRSLAWHRHQAVAVREPGLE
ncbi:Na/Pi cotransporter family protein [Isoalcanivorax beigongshangi]|uniref:Na/Pi cotransporter family protein n=1 Tax=Isoalcanivorax beigongshangi TaxID=3238810 RepID=A0ABV4AGU5_9GAMM